MLRNKRIAVVIPTYNAENTLPKVWQEIPFDIVDEVIVVDDASSDDTLRIAEHLGALNVIVHKTNSGYGAAQKSGYNQALKSGADIIVMLHGDYQYTPKLIRAMVSAIADEVYSVVFASRILGTGARHGRMPYHRYFANRTLTAVQNCLSGQNLSEYHTGFRAFAASVLRSLSFESYSDSFFFDNQIAMGIFARKYEIAEITCPTRYEADSSSIRFWAGMRYVIQVLWLAIRYRLYLWGIGTL